LPGKQRDTFLEEFVNVMDDDLNTAGAIAVVFEKIKEMNTLMDLHADKPDDGILSRLENDRQLLFSAAQVLGLLDGSPEVFFSKLCRYAETTDIHEVERMIEERAKARAEKDWVRADAIRKRLHGMGIVLEDGAQGTTWRFDV